MAHHTVDGRDPPNQLSLVVYPTIYCGHSINIPGGDGRISEASTVWQPHARASRYAANHLQQAVTEQGSCESL